MNQAEKTSKNFSFDFESYQLFSSPKKRAIQTMECIAKEINQLDIPVVLRTAGDDIQTNKKLNYGIRLNSDRDKMIKAGLKDVDKLVAISPAITR